MTLLLDDTVQLPLTVRNASSQVVHNAPVVWTSSSPNVVALDAGGRARAIAVGTSEIIAAIGGDTARLRLTIAPHFLHLSTGGIHTCGLAGNGIVYCWGSNLNGELGVPGPPPTCPKDIGGSCSPVPVAAAGEPYTHVIAGDQHTCALTATGVAYCWGLNWFGQLGTGSTALQRSSPTPVAGNLTFASLITGRWHTCGITTGGDSYCWGWDHTGQLGTGVVSPDRCLQVGGEGGDPCRRTPTLVVGGHAFTTLSAAEKTTCALTTGGETYCWGSFFPALSDGLYCMGGSSGCIRTPALIDAPDFATIGVGDVHRCGLTASGTVYCWGVNYEGWFGNGTTTPSATPTLGGGGHAYTQLVVGRLHTCGLDAPSAAHCWGANASGQLGDGTNAANRLSPVLVVGGHQFATIAAGGSSETTCGIDKSGRAYCWGDGRFGQIGDGGMVSRSEPVQVRLTRENGRVE